MMRFVLVPCGFPCSLAECPPGPFCSTGTETCFGAKSEYGDGDPICLDSGEAWASTDPVMPCRVERHDD